MERESFEDEEVAAILNEHFVPIKVDREERPDIDHIYMMACHAMTGQGGWPLTVILTPDRRPFFAGTYFPKERKYGRAGLLELLLKLAALWENDQTQADEIGRELERHLKQDVPRAPVPEPSKVICEAAHDQLRMQFDVKWGGFSGPPKFPSPQILLFLLRHYSLAGEKSALDMALKTLDAMQRGGIWDHVGLGFSRYSTDEKWMIPHFEKMLYDNALLAHAYLDAFAITKDSRYAAIARDIFTYVLRDMTGDEGEFYCAEDADSDGEEGRFYVFTPEEIHAILEPELARVFCAHFGITEEGNFEGRSVPNVIHIATQPWTRVSGYDQASYEAAILAARQKVFTARLARVRPHKDDKVLTGWNALMIGALAKGYRVLGDPHLLAAAKKAHAFIDRFLRQRDGRLLARFRDGEAKYVAYQEDYAYLAWAQVELYEATLDLAHLQNALKTLHEMRRLFFDEQNGGFYFYGEDGESLLVRPKELYDGAVPSGNSVAAYVLAKIAALTGDTEWTELRDRQIETFYGMALQYPTGYTFFLMALQTVLYPTKELVLSCSDPQKDGVYELFASTFNEFRPQVSVLLRTRENAQQLAHLAPFTEGQVPVNERLTAYVCEQHACRIPITDMDELTRALR